MTGRCVALLVLGGCGAAATTNPSMAPREAVPQDVREETAVREQPKAEAPKAIGVVEGGNALDVAPAGQFLRASDDARFDLRGALKDRGAIVVFYRGHWCKQCRAQLKELSSRADLFREQGYDLYAISTDDTDASRKLKRAHRLDMTLLSDPGGVGIAAWNVYSREHDLARAAVFIVDPGGRIRYRYVSEQPSDRPTLETLERALAPDTEKK